MIAGDQRYIALEGQSTKIGRGEGVKSQRVGRNFLNQPDHIFQKILQTSRLATNICLQIVGDLSRIFHRSHSWLFAILVLRYSTSSSQRQSSKKFVLPLFERKDSTGKSSEYLFKAKKQFRDHGEKFFKCVQLCQKTYTISNFSLSEYLIHLFTCDATFMCCVIESFGFLLLAIKGFTKGQKFLRRRVALNACHITPPQLSRTNKRAPNITFPQISQVSIFIEFLIRPVGQSTRKIFFLIMGWGTPQFR